jgi:hypothetical protein
VGDDGDDGDDAGAVKTTFTRTSTPFQLSRESRRIPQNPLQLSAGWSERAALPHHHMSFLFNNRLSLEGYGVDPCRILVLLYYYHITLYYCRILVYYVGSLHV